MKKIFFIIFPLLSISLSAQHLYFIRATANGGYAYYDIPPAHIIAYSPEQDTVLQIRKDYTDKLSSKHGELRSVVYYPKLNVFCFKMSNFETYILNTNKIDTLMKFIIQCPDNYSVSPFLSLNIINGYWAYECNNDNASDEDYAVFNGIDFLFTKKFDLKAADFKDLHLTGGNSQRVILKPNSGYMYLSITADTAMRPPFSVELPQKYWVSQKTFTVIRINDELQTLVSLEWRNPKAGEEEYGRHRGALYNKQKDKWSDITLKGNAPTIMAYGQWLAGIVQDVRDWNNKYFPERKISPGKSIRDSVYMENSFDEWAQNYGIYRPGILYLFNTDTQKYIEWNTYQGDSEILLVQDEIVYYRVFDEIYKVPIINGEKLGKPELLVKDNQVVPFIHWAFFGK